MKPENAFAFRPEGAPDSWPEKSQRNEAAERLRSWLNETIALRLVAAKDSGLVDEALAAERALERAATVERIRERLASSKPKALGGLSILSALPLEIGPHLLAILDEEAAR